jgi:tetratricopeptide (TPR) repeat protein
MYRMTLCAAAALLVATAVQPATADDASMCISGTGDEEIAACSRLLALDPKPFAYNNRGNAYNQKGEYDRAIADLDQAIRLDPKLTGAYANRGVAYEAKNDPDHAIADYDQALTLNPSLARARQSLQRVQALLAKRSNPGAQTNTPPR